MRSYLKTIQLKDFRCFESVEFDLDGPLVLISGMNGSGKTSLLEALHYIGYLRSFRTRLPREIIRFGAETFFIKVVCKEDEITIGCNTLKRHVKINKKPITSFSDLWKFHRIITVTEDDLDIVKGGPEKRRSFIDSSIALRDPHYSETIRIYKAILDNRNALLQKNILHNDEFLIWTKKLWEQSTIIQETRKKFLNDLEKMCTELSSKNFSKTYAFSFSYAKKYNSKANTWDNFFKEWKEEVQIQEIRQKRTLFGAHVDDIQIFFQKKPARIYSSRGQQKLIVMLIKMGFISIVATELNSLSFLIDDFLTDFDQKIMKELLEACLKLNVQLIFTSPQEDGGDVSLLREYNPKEIKLSI